MGAAQAWQQEENKNINLDQQQFAWVSVYLFCKVEIFARNRPVFLFAQLPSRLFFVLASIQVLLKCVIFCYQKIICFYHGNCGNSHGHTKCTEELVTIYINLEFSHSHPRFEHWTFERGMRQRKKGVKTGRVKYNMFRLYLVHLKKTVWIWSLDYGFFSGVEHVVSKKNCQLTP